MSTRAESISGGEPGGLTDMLNGPHMTLGLSKTLCWTAGTVTLGDREQLGPVLIAGEGAVNECQRST